MNPYTWMVWQRNRLVGYVEAFSEWEAYAKAAKQYGSEFYIERPYTAHNKNSVSA